jgi:hypothetical protein
VRLFISYAHKDKELVRQHIVDILEKAGHDPWFDEELRAGVDWQEEIYRRIHASHALVFAITPDSLGSEWARWELRQAVDAEKRIIPVLLRDARLPPSLSRIQYVDFRAGATGDAVARLMGGLQRISQDEVPPAPEHPRGKPSTAPGPGQQQARVLDMTSTTAPTVRSQRAPQRTRNGFPWGMSSLVLAGLLVLLLVLIVGGATILFSQRDDEEAAGRPRPALTEPDAATAGQTAASMPTRTLTHLPASTPTPSAAPDATPTDPDIELRWDNDSFHLENISGRVLDVSGLVFEGDASGEFEGQDWIDILDGEEHVAAALRPGRCLHILPGDLREAERCHRLDYHVNPFVSLMTFWKESAGNTFFSVRHRPAGEMVAECAVADGRCRFALP